MNGSRIGNHVNLQNQKKAKHCMDSSESDNIKINTNNVFACVIHTQYRMVYLHHSFKVLVHNAHQFHFSQSRFKSSWSCLWPCLLLPPMEENGMETWVPYSMGTVAWYGDSNMVWGQWHGMGTVVW